MIVIKFDHSLFESLTNLIYIYIFNRSLFNKRWFYISLGVISTKYHNMHCTWILFICFSALFSITVECIQMNTFSLEKQRTILISESIKLISAKSLLVCAMICSTDDKCLYGSYNSERSECILDGVRNVSFEESTSGLVFMKYKGILMRLDILFYIKHLVFWRNGCSFKCKF